MAFKTRLLESLKAFRWKEVAEALRESPKLKQVLDERGRNWLHVCCATDPSQGGREAARQSLESPRWGPGANAHTRTSSPNAG